MNKKQIEVVAAVLMNGGQFLAVQRGGVEVKLCE